MIFLGYPKKLGAFAKNQRRYRKKHSTFAPIKSTKRMKLFKTILFIALVYSVGVASVVHAPHSCPKRAQKRVLEFFKKYL